MSNQTNEAKREKFTIKVTEHAKLNTIAQTAYLSSNDFSKMVSDLFKNVFADFEGCLFEPGIPVGNGVPTEPTISLLFNHGVYSEDATCACEKAGGRLAGNSVIDRMRNTDRARSEGDRYLLTEDGKDVITDLLIDRIRNTNSNINWKNIVSEWVDRGAMNMFNVGQPVQYTKVSNLSLRRLCGLLFGSKDENGDFVDYDVHLAAPLNPNGTNIIGMTMDVNYILTITEISTKEVAKIYEKLGFSNIGGTRIVR